MTTTTVPIRGIIAKIHTMAPTSNNGSARFKVTASQVHKETFGAFFKSFDKSLLTSSKTAKNDFELKKKKEVNFD